MENINHISFRQRIQSYLKNPLSLLILITMLLCVAATTGVLVYIIYHILSNGMPQLTLSLFSFTYNSTNVSVFPAIITTFYMVFIALIIAGPIGIFCAIYLVEYASRSNRVVKYIRIATETLSGIPSIVFGLFGMLFFVLALGWRYSLIAGAGTLAIMVLPLIIRSTEEALKSVPDTFREASYGLGANRLRTVFVIVLPSAMPGILAGIILAVGRIVGETAALIYTAGTVAKIPESLFASGRTLAIHMYVLASEGLRIDQAYATAVVLLITVMILNFVASAIAKKLQK